MSLGSSSSDVGVSIDQESGATDVQSFESWFEEQWPRLLRVLAAYCGDEERAADAAAEALVRAAERWDHRRPRNPTAWVTTVAFNLVKGRRREEPVDWTRLPSETVGVTATDPDLWAAVARLPSRMHEAVVLRYVGDLTEAGVAEAMGIRPGAASSLLSKARDRLGRDLRAQETERTTTRSTS